MTAGFWSAAARLLILQASWTYERLQGIGTGFATVPLLESLKSDPERYQEAVARSVDHANAHPYLAGITVGAAARAEADGMPGERIGRLKTALSGPLGSLGDQLFWIGVVPAVMGAILVGLAMGGGLAVVVAGWALYVVLRLVVTVWGLRIGYAAGSEVAPAIKASRLPDRARRAGYVAGFAMGLAVPMAMGWMAGAASGPIGVVAAVGGAGGFAAAVSRKRLPTARRLTVIVVGVVLLWGWSMA